MSPVVVTLGSVFTLSVFLPDDHQPLLIKEAIVRWIEASRFGLEFLTIGAAGRERLRALLEPGRF
ncbi:MAG TPA: PilZ domain-containing protein [Nitrospira sp.]|nr:PilZ domain-containing protein [Nitrospira sp.]